MRPCRFCGRWFKNTQAVRAHLKRCPDYQGTRKERDAAEARFQCDECQLIVGERPGYCPRCGGSTWIDLKGV